VKYHSKKHEIKNKSKLKVANLNYKDHIRFE